MGRMNPEQLNNLIEELDGRGWLRPFMLITVGANGAAVGVRHDRGVAEPLFQHGGPLTPPVNIMVVDANGAAARISIRADGSTTFH